MSSRSKRSGQTIETQIVVILYEKGPMLVRDMIKFIPSTYKSVSSSLYKLKAIDLVDKDEDGIWSLKPGVTPEILTGKETSHPFNETSEDSSWTPRVTDGEVDILHEFSDIVLNPRDDFIQHMLAIGVRPEGVVPTIADIFFSEDINSIAWLNKVLRDEAAGYVTPPQRTLMVAYWATTRGLRNEYEEILDEELVSGGVSNDDIDGDNKSALVSRPFDLGLGWRIGKNKRGHWVPLPGGPATYEEAADWAAQRELLSGYEHRPRED